MIGGGTRTNPIMFAMMRKVIGMSKLESPNGLAPFSAGMRPMPQQPSLTITGVTRDSTGAALGGVSLEVFRVDGTLASRTTSDGSGNYTTDPVGLGTRYQIDAYLTGSPDRAGTTQNTLQGA